MLALLAAHILAFGLNNTEKCLLLNVKTSSFLLKYSAGSKRNAGAHHP